MSEYIDIIDLGMLYRHNRNRWKMNNLKMGKILVVLKGRKFQTSMLIVLKEWRIVIVVWKMCRIFLLNEWNEEDDVDLETAVDEDQV